MSWRFITCTALFVTCLVTANTIGAKLIAVGGVVLTAGIVIFPLSYVLGDVLTEVWGYTAARRVIWLGFACNALTVAAIWVGAELPAAPFWTGQGAYEEILGQTPRILLASFVAYLAGEFANAFVLAKLKILTRGRWLWTRTVGFMLGHARILGRFVDWLLTAGTPGHGLAYPAFRATAGRGGLTAFYAVCGLQVISVIAFLVLALASGRARGAAALAAVAGVL